MNYRLVYLRIISKAKQEEKENKRDFGYYEKHHIMPKSLFPLWRNKQSNIVKLTAREHLFCHMLLVKIYPKSHEIWSALWYMSSKSKKEKSHYPKLTLREYERIKIKYAESNSNHLKGKKNPNMARNFSKETLLKIGEKSKGNTNTKGKLWWTKDGESKMSFDCPGDGWVKGRNTKGHVAWNKGISPSQETIEKFKKSVKEKNKNLTDIERKAIYARYGHIPWNKDKKMSDKARKNMSLAQTSRFNSSIEREKMSKIKSKKVIELKSGIIFDSLKKCALFYGHTNPWVIKRMQENFDENYYFKYI